MLFYNAIEDLAEAVDQQERCHSSCPLEEWRETFVGDWSGDQWDAALSLAALCAPEEGWAPAHETDWALAVDRQEREAASRLPSVPPAMDVDEDWADAVDNQEREELFRLEAEAERCLSTVSPLPERQETIHVAEVSWAEQVDRQEREWLEAVTQPHTVHPQPPSRRETDLTQASWAEQVEEQEWLDQLAAIAADQPYAVAPERPETVDAKPRPASPWQDDSLSSPSPYLYRAIRRWEEEVAEQRELDLQRSPPSPTTPEDWDEDIRREEEKRAKKKINGKTRGEREFEDSEGGKRDCLPRPSETLIKKSARDSAE